MSAIHTWACFLLWIGFTAQDKTPDVTVTCFVSDDCILPCSFQPSSKETVQWFRQDTLVYKYERKDGDDDDDDDDDDSDSGEQHEQFSGRVSVVPRLISNGNATLVLRKTDLKDRGTYRCQVQTEEGKHSAKVILKVEAPIRGLSLVLSRLSGYEEMKCTVQNVYPAPRVAWVTEPATFEDLRPVTRKLANKNGLYTVDSRLRLLNGQPDLIYICKVVTPYGGPAWTASLREREIRGTQGKDVTIPCKAPTYLNDPALNWTFSDGKEPLSILTYDRRSGRTDPPAPWNKHVEMDIYKVQFGDGSLRLMDPKSSEHTGTFTCMFSVPHNTYTERTDVLISGSSVQQNTSDKPTHWWVIGLVIVGLLLALGGMLVYLKCRGKNPKSRNDPEEVRELHLVKDAAAASDRSTNESSPLTVGGTNGQSHLQSGAHLT